MNVHVPVPEALIQERVHLDTEKRLDDTDENSNKTAFYSDNDSRLDLPVVRTENHADHANQGRLAVRHPCPTTPPLCLLCTPLPSQRHFKDVRTALHGIS